MRTIPTKPEIGPDAACVACTYHEIRPKHVDGNKFQTNSKQLLGHLSLDIVHYASVIFSKSATV